MSNRIKCTRCDAMILEVTARVNSGLCAHCKSSQNRSDLDSVVQGWINDPSSLPGSHGNPEPQDFALKLAAIQIRSRLYPLEEDKIDAFCHDFFEVAHKKWTYRGTSGLSDREKHGLAIESFYGEVLNGGLVQYLGNESGSFAQWADEAFEAIGIPVYAEIIRKVKKLFPGGRIPEAASDRWNVVECVDEEQLEKIEIPFWNRYEDRKNEIRDLLYAYLIRTESQDSDPG